MYTINDIGCYADGRFGHARIRSRLVGLLSALEHAPRGGVGLLWPEAKTLVASLQRPYDRDFGDEIDALDLLNEHTCSWEVYFKLHEGDLRLVPSREYINQHGKTE
jgi:hypothetical protein